MLNPLQGLLEEGVEQKIFPAAQAVVWHRGRQVFQGLAGEATAETQFDLASVTKIFSTATLFMCLWNEGLLTPEAKLARFRPKAPSSMAGATVADLLYHRSGLPAFRPFFEEALRARRELLERDCAPDIRRQAREEVAERAWQAPLAAAPKTVVNYSDVGFIQLGELLAQVGGAELDTLFEEKVARRLGVEVGFHRLSHSHSPASAPFPVAPTGRRRPREPAPGQEGVWGATPEAASLEGSVDDDNAYVLDGVAGHAGLFGTASTLARYGQAVLEEFEGAQRWAKPVLWEQALRLDPEMPGSMRTLGFDTTATGAVGHLGFTGVSLWVDLSRRWVVALCTNRVFYGRDNQGIRAFRPLFHNAVIRHLGL